MCPSDFNRPRFSEARNPPQPAKHSKDTRERACTDVWLARGIALTCCVLAGPFEEFLMLHYGFLLARRSFSAALRSPCSGLWGAQPNWTPHRAAPRTPSPAPLVLCASVGRLPFRTKPKRPWGRDGPTQPLERPARRHPTRRTAQATAATRSGQAAPCRRRWAGGAWQAFPAVSAPRPTAFGAQPELACCSSIPPLARTLPAFGPENCHSGPAERPGPTG